MKETKRKPSLSPSARSMFEQCQLKWKFRYVDGIKEPAGRPALLGTFVHLLLELLYAYPAEDRTRDNARRCGKEAWPETEANEEFKALGLDEAGILLFKQDAWRLVETYFEMEDPTAVNPVSLERELKAEVGTVPFYGFVDRVTENEDGGLVVTDYKTGKSPNPRYADGKLDQVFEYAAAIEAADGTPVSEVTMMFLGDGKTMAAKVTPEQIQETRVRLQGTWDEITAAKQSNEFSHSTGPLCGWCFYVDSCEAGATEVKRRFNIGRMKPTAPALAKLGL